MLLSKLWVCRNACPALLNASKLLPKTLTPLKFMATQTPGSLNIFRNIKILKNPPFKLELFSRKNTTVVLQPSSGKAEKSVGIWLMICSGAVYLAILFGGYTRLTESGLSMVTWRFAHETYPANEEEWVAEFEKYKQYPEYKLLKKDMTLEEFKRIWHIEYFHRNWGRVVGLIFLVPAVSFWIRGHLQKAMKKRVAVLGLLLVSQGLLGWYMVRSGLEDRFKEQSDVPRVSQYRLAAHLGLAIILYSGLFLTSLKMLLPAKTITEGVHKKTKILKMLAYSSKGLVFLTALSGALVAGLDAGLVYNSFPKMGDKWIPDDILALYPTLKNFTENPTTVQFDHRILGMTTLLLIGCTSGMSMLLPLTRRARRAAKVLLLAGFLQVALGISTLVHHVPVNLGLAHQSGSIMLLSSALWLCHELNFLKYIPK